MPRLRSCWTKSKRATQNWLLREMIKSPKIAGLLPSTLFSESPWSYLLSDQVIDLQGDGELPVSPPSDVSCWARCNVSLSCVLNLYKTHIRHLIPLGWNVCISSISREIKVKAFVKKVVFIFIDFREKKTLICSTYWCLHGLILGALTGGWTPNLGVWRWCSNQPSYPARAKRVVFINGFWPNTEVNPEPVWGKVEEIGKYGGGKRQETVLEQQ